MWLSMVLYNVSCMWCALLWNSRYCHFFFVVEQNQKLSLNSPTCEDHCLVMYYLAEKLKQVSAYVGFHFLNYAVLTG